MTNLRKIMAVILAITMIMSLAVSVSATGSQQTYTITIKNDTSGYTYEAYQIFSGTYNDNTKSLGDVEWGSGVDSDKYSDLLTALKEISITNASGDTVYPFTSDESSSGDALTTAADVAAALSKYNTNTEIAEKFADVIADYLASTTTYSTSTFDTDHYTISNLPAGYYFIKNSVVPSGGAYTAYILEVTANETISNKASVPEHNKTVDDVNDSTGVETPSQSTADYDIGDEVPFTQTLVIGANYDKYDEYKVVFYDTMSTGLSVNSDSFTITVTDNGVTPTTTTVVDGYVIAYTYEQVTVTEEEFGDNSNSYYYTYTAGGTPEYQVATSWDGTATYYVRNGFTITMDDTNSLTDSSNDPITVATGYTITVTYTATLNETAEYHEENAAYVTYSSNPNGNEEGRTVTRITTVFEYTLTVNKTDGQNSPLTGAAFTLYKMVEDPDVDDQTDFTTNTYYTYTSPTYTKADSYTQGYTYYHFVEVETIDGTSTSTFVFEGLDDGVYKLVESTTPSGYNTADDILFAVISVLDNTNQEITSLSAKQVSDDGSGNLTVTSTDSSVQTSVTNSNKQGDLTATVINNTGAELPETGGIGTTIFYVVGGILVVGAVVLLITKKRLGNKED